MKRPGIISADLVTLAIAIIAMASSDSIDFIDCNDVVWVPDCSVFCGIKDQGTIYGFLLTGLRAVGATTGCFLKRRSSSFCDPVPCGAGAMMLGTVHV